MPRGVEGKCKGIARIVQKQFDSQHGHRAQELALRRSHGGTADMYENRVAAHGGAAPGSTLGATLISFSSSISFSWSSTTEPGFWALSA